MVTGQATMHSALPPEIWTLILEDLPTKSLKALCLVSRTLQAQARRRMYRTLIYCDAINRSCCPRTDSQRIRDITIFHQSLVNWEGYREVTKDVSIEWTHGIEWHSTPYPGKSESEAEQQFSDMVKDTVVLLSKSYKLHSLHLGLPLLDSTVPFHVDRITSLRIPISGCQYETDDPGFSTLLKLFQIPTLRRVQLDCMLRLCCVVPHACRQPNTSNVTELEFINCGPISEELINVLNWPADLQILRFDVTYGESGRPFASPNASVRSDKMMTTLSLFKDSIQVLDLQVYESDCIIPDQTGALHSFSKLKWLKIPRRLLKIWAEDLEFHDLQGVVDTAPPIEMQLPDTLEYLHISIGENFCWIHDNDVAEEGDSNLLPERPSENAKELFILLSGLATPGRFPNLHELWLYTEDYEHHAFTPEFRRRQDYPLECDHTRMFVDLLEQRDIEVYFDGYKWSELEKRIL
ncbi:hypothetical protein D6C79_08543 [Aureobasidium pullulans]|nr:hypothetical protein D6C79_08543 [Aureobasidium pullulans]